MPVSAQTLNEMAARIAVSFAKLSLAAAVNELKRLKQDEPTLHALVVSKLGKQ